MAIQQGVWGIDLGQCALKALRVENIDGQVTATAFDYVEHPKILSQPDADPDQLTREALEKFLSRNDIKGDVVCISIPGQSGLARFVKLPPVEEKKIPDIVKFEAKQQIPFNLDEVVWDYQKISSGIVTDGFAMETEIGLFAIKRDTVNRYLQHFKDVKVEVHVVQMAPLSLCNYLSYDLLGVDAGSEGEGAGKKNCVVALDIGTDNSNLVITDGGRIIWQRPIPLGGNHFTRVLTKDMKLTFAKAEHLKRNATKSPDLKQILASLKPVLNDFVGEVQRSLGYFTNTHRDANIQHMMGLGSAFRLPGLQKFVGEKLGLEIRKLNKFERLAGDDVVNQPVYTENLLSFAVAYGLALQGLKVARLQTNLLPHEIQVERMIRAKKPVAVAAAASILLATSALGVGYNMQYRAYGSDVVENAKKQAESVKKKADGFNTAVSGVQAKIEEHKKGVKSVVIGQDERMNWLHINQFVANSLPRPDGSNLSAEAKKKFWNESAQQAYASFMAQNSGKAKIGEKGADEESWREDLIQANVEGVFSVYCLDLAAGYIPKLKADQAVLINTMKPAELAKPPEGKGWIFELRGYTYHNKGFEFVKDAIVDNLQRLPIRTDLLTPDAATAAPAAASGTTPATAAAAPAAAATAGATASADKPLEKMEHPIWNKVSHVVLYRYFPDDRPDPDQFKLIGQSIGMAFLGASGAGGSEMGMGGPGMGGPKRSSGSGMMQVGPGGGGGGEPGAGGAAGALTNTWSPLGSTSLGGGGGAGFGGMPGGAEPGKPGGAGFGAPMGGPGRTSGSGGMQLPVGGPGAAGGAVAKPGAGGPQIGMPNFSRTRPGGGEPGMIVGPGGEQPRVKGQHKRVEFIIFFVWREPTPSDALLPAEEASGGGTTIPVSSGGIGGPGAGGPGSGS